MDLVPTVMSAVTLAGVLAGGLAGWTAGRLEGGEAGGEGWQAPRGGLERTGLERAGGPLVSIRMFKMARRPRNIFHRGSLKDLFGYLHIRMFKKRRRSIETYLTLLSSINKIIHRFILFAF